MRITNKIMQSNTLYNINQNKLAQDKISTQITTKKKITKPSDDPVIAIRALRLRSNLNQVSQYYEKNIPDADQWIDLTETAIETTTDIISAMIAECEKGAKSSLTTSDRATILDSLKQLRDEVYSTGDSDYAGRTVFTGYRTDMKLSFQSNTIQDFSITEQLNNDCVSKITHVDIGNIYTVNDSNYNTGTFTTEQEVSKNDIHRIRLAYNNLDANTDVSVETVSGYNPDGTQIKTTLFSATTISQNATPDPYELVTQNPDEAYFIPETGEILLGENKYASIMALSPDTEIDITYSKNEWLSGDLRPEHYFRCESEGIVYNDSYLTQDGKNHKQVISYDVGFNQSIDVNTTADEVFNHGIAREVDEMIAMLTQSEEVDMVVKKLEGMIGNTAYDQDAVNERLDAAKKAQVYLRDTIQKKFESGITQFQGYLNQATEALTKVGNRSLRLELIENRLSAQELGFEELTSENEDADLAELAVKFSSASLTYDASLAATGKMLKTTLLNYL